MARFQTLEQLMDYIQLDASGNVTMIGGLSSRAPVITASADRTLLASETGTIVRLNKTDGLTVTLPSPQVGLRFSFIFSVDTASSATVIATSSASVFMNGVVEILVINAATGRPFVGNGTTHVKMSCGSSTTGGLAGGRIEAICTTPTLWSMTGQLVGTGTPTTPFST